MTEPRKGDWMQTFTGKQFWPADPRAEEIDIRDIAHALSMQCRYAGHCLRFYSVAEHSVHVARWVAATYGGSTALQLKALLHDATEAYLVDVPRPVKPFLVGYKEAEARLWKVIANSHGMSDEMPSEVHEADNRILWDERAQNMSPSVHEWSGNPDPLGINLEFWSPDRAESKFLNAYREITAEGGLS
jgi:hypothetical protein